LIRAFIGNLAQSGRLQGGSTITQQIVKNLLVGEDRTYERKIREMIIAARPAVNEVQSRGILGIGGQQYPVVRNPRRDHRNHVRLPVGQITAQNPSVPRARAW
jgi:hypothetical protein